MLKTLFFGTPALVVPYLKLLAQKSRVLGVVTSPDKPAGRGQETAEPEVKKAARELGFPIIQPSTLRDGSALAAIKAWGPADLGIVAAYGKLIPPEIFSHPARGLVNVHFSLLPKYRGAGPVQWSLINGEKETGVTLFQIEQGLDSGPVYLQRSLAIAPEDNARTLFRRLVPLGLELVEEALKKFEDPSWKPAPQQGTPTPAPLLKKEDGRISWETQTAGAVADLVRGTYEWPGAFSLIKGQGLKVRAAEVSPRKEGKPGAILGVEEGKGFLVRCRDQALLVLRVKPQGKKEMDALSFWNGARLKAGDRFDGREEGGRK